MLDTVNPNGKDDGSLDQTQFAWLGSLLERSRGRIVVVASHHTVDTMTNPLVGTGGEAEPRVLGDEVEALLLQHPQVVAWVNGHTHTQPGLGAPAGRRHGRVLGDQHGQPRRLPDAVAAGRGRRQRDGTLSLFTTMLDHAGPLAHGGDLTDPTALAGLSRELGANDPQERSHNRRGVRGARNVELLVADPR